MRCYWCHNPESQNLMPEVMLHVDRCIACEACLEACTQGAISLRGNEVHTDRALCVQCGLCTPTCFADAREVVGREMSVSELMAEIESDISFYDESGGGVTFSGGDPLFQRDFLLALLIACREQEIHTAVDTAGFFSWATIDKIRPYVDLFLYDLKTMDDVKHKEMTGVSNRLILQNLAALSAHGHKIIIRVAIIPGVNDDEDNTRLTAEFAAALPNLQGLSLLPYHATAIHKYDSLNRGYKMPDMPPPADEQIGALARILRDYGLSVKIGG